jgi:hypothetical protein
MSGGHCLVNWKKCLRPKRWGGLGIKDLDNFSRALRLHWLWHNWDIHDKPWKHLLRIADPTNRKLSFHQLWCRSEMIEIHHSRRLDGCKEQLPKI